MPTKNTAHNCLTSLKDFKFCTFGILDFFFENMEKAWKKSGICISKKCGNDPCNRRLNMCALGCDRLRLVAIYDMVPKTHIFNLPLHRQCMSVVVVCAFIVVRIL